MPKGAWALMTPEQKSRAADWQREFRRTPEGRRHVRAMNLKKYGLTPEMYDAIEAAQGGVCRVCDQPETSSNQFGPMRLAVDHCHETGRVRGLLCARCNRSLGLLGNDAERIQALANYARSDHDARSV